MAEGMSSNYKRKIQECNNEIKRLLNRRDPLSIDEQVKTLFNENMKNYQNAISQGMPVPERDFMVSIAIETDYNYEEVYRILYGRDMKTDFLFSHTCQVERSKKGRR